MSFNKKNIPKTIKEQKGKLYGSKARERERPRIKKYSKIKIFLLRRKNILINYLLYETIFKVFIFLGSASRISNDKPVLCLIISPL